jgi:plasmid stability protein
MKTTLNIDDTVMKRLKETAAARGTTMSVLVEAGLRRVLAAEPGPSTQESALKPLPSWDGGEPRVDVANRDELYRFMEEER